MSTPSDTELLTVAELAGLFNVSQKTVYRWVADGRVDSFLADDGTRQFPAAQFTARLRGTREGGGES